LTAEAGQALLRVQDVAVRFGGIVALDGVSFDVAPGRIVGLIGPNGAGKTTLFNLIHGELLADSGDVYFYGRSIVGMPTHAIARRGMGRTFQVPATFASMTVRESIALVLASRARRDATVLSSMLAVADRCEPFLARLLIADLADAHCAALAYGDAKRVEVALALAGEPRLLLMDEPTAGLAPPERARLMRQVSDLARSAGAALLFTEHDMDVVFAHAERIVVLNRGRLIAAGSPSEVRADREVRAVYLGGSAGAECGDA